jgi:5-carboxymethyl-2-hydroxymuconate isomerase
MPHLIIEYPAGLADAGQGEAMLTAVYGAAAGTGLFDERHIRVRGWPLTHYMVGGEHRPFIHVQCRIHAGRTATQRRMLSDAVLAALRAQPLAVSVITVEVVEMDRDSYAKYVPQDSE